MEYSVTSEGMVWECCYRVGDLLVSVVVVVEWDRTCWNAQKQDKHAKIPQADGITLAISRYIHHSDEKVSQTTESAGKFD